MQKYFSSYFFINFWGGGGGGGGGLLNCQNFQSEIFCRRREISVEAGSFDSCKTPTIML